MAEEVGGTDYWVAQAEMVVKRLDTIARRVEALDEKVEHYITSHDEWCAGLSQAVRGAAEVLTRIERYAGSSPDVVLDDVDVPGSPGREPGAGRARSQ